MYCNGNCEHLDSARRIERWKMMEEKKDRYLFRGKRIDNGEWVVGNLINSPDGRVAISETSGDWELHECIPTTICQCTGLRDKTGKLIWENDIAYMRCNGLSGFGTVIYRDGSFWIDDKKRGRQYPFSNHDVKYRVDGNRFGNPELLNY